MIGLLVKDYYCVTLPLILQPNIKSQEYYFFVHTFNYGLVVKNSLWTFLSLFCFSTPAANGLSTISHEYLKGSYALDLEAVKQGACSLPHLNKTLVASCKRLNG